MLLLDPDRTDCRGAKPYCLGGYGVGACSGRVINCGSGVGVAGAASIVLWPRSAVPIRPPSSFSITTLTLRVLRGTGIVSWKLDTTSGSGLISCVSKVNV